MYVGNLTNQHTSISAYVTLLHVGVKNSLTHSLTFVFISAVQMQDELLMAVCICGRARAFRLNRVASEVPATQGGRVLMGETGYTRLVYMHDAVLNMDLVEIYRREISFLLIAQ